MTFFIVVHRLLPVSTVYIVHHVSVYDPFLNEKPLFHKKFPSSHLFKVTSHFSRASLNTTSPNIGGRMYGPSPTSNFLGDRSPSPLSSRPWLILSTRSQCQRFSSAV